MLLVLVQRNCVTNGAKVIHIRRLKLDPGVNLELLHDDIDAFRDARPQKPFSSNVEYFRVRDWEPNVVMAPNVLDSHVAAFLAIVRTSPKPIYVHCRAGQNRTGVMVAAYRVLAEGASIDSAIAEIQKYQGAWFKQDAEYIRGLTGERRTEIKNLVELPAKQVRPEARLECSASGCKKAM
ncbi:MAG: protein-tyrosine phosphatase family protein [Acinetobacter sp.]